MRKIMGLSLVFCWGLCLTSASVRADDPKDKAALPAQAKKPGADGAKDNYFSEEGHHLGKGSTAHVWEAESLATTRPDPFVPPADAAEAKAFEAITKLGGTVTRDDKLPGKPLIGVNLAGTQVTDAAAAVDR